MTKKCTKCNEIKDSKEFYRCTGNKTNYQSRCKSCNLNTVKSRYRAMDDKSKQKQKDQQKARLRDPKKKARAQAQIAYARAKAVERLPFWYKSIENQYIEIYRKAIELTLETGLKHEVDHIIPLRNKDICGLS